MRRKGLCGVYSIALDDFMKDSEATNIRFFKDKVPGVSDADLRRRLRNTIFKTMERLGYQAGVDFHTLSTSEEPNSVIVVKGPKT